MIKSIFVAFFVVLIISIISCIWILICNKITHYEVNNILPEVGDPNFWEKLEICKEVSYEQHLWYRLTFRNPMKLYRKINHSTKV
jgi:hypothetical protein